MSTPVSFQLSAADAAALPRLIRQGHGSARRLSRARVLLLAHQGLSPEAVAAAVLVSRATVYNVWARYRAHGLDAALRERPRSGQPRKVTPRVEAAITHLACSEAPNGAGRWSVRLLWDRLVVLGHKLSEEAVRLVLKKSAQALAAPPVMHRSGRWGVSGRDGAGAGPLRAATPSASSAAVL